MTTYITDPDELTLVPCNVRVCGTWTEHQYVSNTLTGQTTFTRLGDCDERPLWPTEVLGSEIQVSVHRDDVRKMLRILEALEVCVPEISPTLAKLLTRLRQSVSKSGV